MSIHPEFKSGSHLGEVLALMTLQPGAGSVWLPVSARLHSFHIQGLP